MQNEKEKDKEKEKDNTSRGSVESLEGVKLLASMNIHPDDTLLINKQKKYAAKLEMDFLSYPRFASTYLQELVKDGTLVLAAPRG